MVVTYGVVVESVEYKDRFFASVFEPIDLSWDACLKYCLKEIGCVVVQEVENKCELYRAAQILAIIKVDAVNGSRVGIKRTMNFCPPIESDPPMFGEATIQEQFVSETIAYSYKIIETTKNDSILWGFKEAFLFECQGDSFIVNRGGVRVCISYRLFSDPPCQSYTSGETLCQINGGLGLTGPFATGEGKILTDHALKKIENKPFFNYYRSWINGVRSSKTTIEVSDKTLNSTFGYNWPPENLPSDNTMKNIYCALGSDGDDPAFVYLMGEDSYLIDDPGFTLCVRGSFCRTEPLRNYERYTNHM